MCGVTVLLTPALGSSFVDSVAHGTIALVPLDRDDVLSVEFQGRTQLQIGDIAVVPIPLFTDPDAVRVSITLTDGTVIESIVETLDKQYPEERITITDQEQVSPSEDSLKRIRRESALMREAYGRFSAQPKDLLPIIQPIEGRTSGVFGSRRFFNDQPRNPHSGIDWAAPTGTPIKNPAPGTVVVTGEFFFNGKTVMIDHGGGFISMMCHLDQIDVEVDQILERGEIIGTVGTTGRSTGPHLHWSVSLGGIRTDPAVFIERLNALER